MFKYLIAALVGLSLASCSATTAAPEVEPSSLKVDTDEGSGSGIHVGGGVIITAAHVVQDMHNLKVITDDGEEWEVDVIRIDQPNDIAVLRVKDKTGSFSKIDSSPLNCTDPAVGTKIRYRGWPLGIGASTFEGKVNMTGRKFGPWEKIVGADIVSIPGVSGSGVLDADGKIVGIIVGVLAMPQGTKEHKSNAFFGMGFVVPGTVVCKVLAETR